MIERVEMLVCRECGCTFEAIVKNHKRKYYCDACRVKKDNEYKVNRVLRDRERRAAEKLEKANLVWHKAVLHLGAANAVARKHHMTYGKFYAPKVTVAFPEWVHDAKTMNERSKAG